MQFVCFLNRFAGKGDALSKAEMLATRLVRRGHDVRFLETAGNRKVFRDRCLSIKKHERVVCIGGDGTIRNFINNSSKFYNLAFYGTGTANVNTIEYGIPKNPDNFIDMLEESHQINIYPGQTQKGTKFLMMCSFGIDSYILSRVSHNFKMLVGKTAFVIPTMKALLRYSYPSYQLELDGNKRLVCSLAIISRIKRYAGDFVVSPNADSQTDSFQVIVLKNSGFLKTLNFFSGLKSGKLASSKIVSIHTAKRVKISPKNQFTYCQLDGNHWPERIVELTVSSKPIPLVIPKTGISNKNPSLFQIAAR